MVIRKITKEDKEVFIEMGKEFYTSEAVLHDIKGEFHQKAFDELMRSDIYLVCYIFEEEGKTAGYALLNKSFSREVGGAVLWLEELYVRQAFRKRGLGGAFLKFMEREHPAARYRLEIEPDNKRAEELYKRHGYERLGYAQLIKDSGFGM